MPKDTEEALNLLVTCLNTPSSIHERHATAEKLQNLLMNAPEESDDNHYFTMSFLMRRISSYLTNLEKVGMS
jgi:hypothetical protein